jgi:very-short-patch-repair endonuclease
MQKKSAYEKVIGLCERNNWLTYPPHDPEFDYENIFKVLCYSEVKIEIGKTHSPKTWDEFLDLLLKYKEFKNGVTLKSMTFVYGDVVGREKFDKYRSLQAETNTFEYKQKKYGITLEEFKTFNKSRAVTLENLIKKHGPIKGKIKFENYCKRQAYTNSEEYLGTERFKQVNRQKSHTLEVYIERYGKELAEQKLIEFFSEKAHRTSYSKISQKLFDEVMNHMSEKEQKYTYYAEKNREYAVLFETKCYLYDFVCTHLKFCIEYHGDHYHGNPLMYKPNDYLKGRGCTKTKAKVKWEQDEHKITSLKRARDYDTIVIWDLEWRKNPERVMEKILKFIKGQREKLNGGIY